MMMIKSSVSRSVCASSSRSWARTWGAAAANPLASSAVRPLGASAGPTTSLLLQRTLSSATRMSSAGKTSTAAPNLAAMSAGQQVQALAQQNPHVDVVRYTHKNRTWTLQHVQYYSEALAIGLVENGLQPGDVVLSWLPGHFAEQMVLQFACSKAGMILYTLDPALAIEHPERAKQALAAALTLTKANVFLSQEAGSDVNYVRLAEHVIPELRFFVTAGGMPFVTPRFPHLRFCLHTGFDQEDKFGWYLLKHMLVPSNDLDMHIDTKSLNAQTPLAGELVLNAEGLPTKLGKLLTNQQVLQEKLWPTMSNILHKQFHTVEGVGVVW